MSAPHDVIADADIDAEAAMREMMGFSSFTTRPKKRTGKHS